MFSIGDNINLYMIGSGHITGKVIDTITSYDDRSLYLIVYANGKLHKFKQSIKERCFDGEYYKYNEIEYISTYQGLYAPELH